MSRRFAVLTLGVLLSAAAARADDDLVRTPESWSVLRHSWETLRLREGWTLYARPQVGSGVDPFPYVLAATGETRKANRGFAVRPEEFGRYVTPESLGTEAGAMEAVRFFVAGRVVPDAAAARRIVEEARRLASTLKHWAIEVSGTPSFDAGAAPAVRGAEGGASLVTLLALETDLEIALVQVTARVDAIKGSVAIERRRIVKGLPTSWGSCFTGGDLEAVEKEEADRRAETDRVRRVLRAALDPRRTREMVRSLAKPGVTMEAVRAALGEPDDDVGSGIHIWVYALDEGAALVGEAGKVHHVRLVTPVPGSPFAGPKTSESLYPAGG